MPFRIDAEQQERDLAIFRGRFRLDPGKMEEFFFHFKRAVDTLLELLGLASREPMTIEVMGRQCPSCGEESYVAGDAKLRYCSYCGFDMSGGSPEAEASRDGDGGDLSAGSETEAGRVEKAD